MNSNAIERRFDLDWMRVMAIFAIFVFHCTRPFDTDDWHIKNLVTYQLMDVWKDFAMSWGMPLILMISGASLFYALGKVSLGKYLKGICARLLLPLVLGMFTHVAFQVYLENLDKGKFSGSFWQFYPHYFEGMYGFGGNFAWMGLHLWYLEILFLLSLFFLPLFSWLKKTGPGQRLLQRLGELMALPGAVFLLAAPPILLMLKLDPETWGNQSMGGWGVPIYPFFFLYGFLIVSNRRLQVRIQQMRWFSLGLGLLLSPVYLFLEFQTLYPSLRPVAHLLADPLYCLSGWAWLLVVFGFGMRNLKSCTPFLKYANEAVLPFYILHQPVIVTLGFFILHWAIPAWLKFTILLVFSFVLVSGMYEYLVRRTNLLRFLFGMKPLSRPQPAFAGQAPEAAHTI